MRRLLEVRVILLRRYWFAPYWLCLAVYTLSAAEDRGMVTYDEFLRYPLREVFIVWGILALAVCTLHIILRPDLWPISLRRMLGALLFTLVWFGLSVVLLVSDQPGYVIVSARAGFVTLQLLLALSLPLLVRDLWLRRLDGLRGTRAIRPLLRGAVTLGALVLCVVLLTSTIAGHFSTQPDARWPGGLALLSPLAFTLSVILSVVVGGLGIVVRRFWEAPNAS